MISVHGAEGTKEYEAAQALRELISTAWPEVAGPGQQHEIQLIAGAQCYGQDRVDIDILMFGRLGKAFLIPGRSGVSPLYLLNFCLTIEVKGHDPQGVRFSGNQVRVRYSGHWENASQQSFGQQVAVRQYLIRQGVNPPPFVINLIWLRGVAEQFLPPVEHNIIGGDASWGTFLQRIALEQRMPQTPYGRGTCLRAVRDGEEGKLRRAMDVFTRVLVPSRLDRQKMEMVSGGLLTGQKYGTKLGEQLLIFRGRGGTGKTANLLKLAHTLYEEQRARVLILTYNLALVADINRLFDLMGIGGRYAERTIAIETVHSFLHRLLSNLGTLPKESIDFLQRYTEYKTEALELLRALDQREIEKILQENGDELWWHYILIDEGQDWPRDERDLLFTIYDYRHFVVADGVDQLVRSYASIDWRGNLSAVQVVPLQQSLRLKAGLCRFVQAFAEHIGLRG